MCSRCWMTSSQVGLQAGVCMRIAPYAGDQDMLSSTVAHALPACCVPESSTACLQMTRCLAMHGKVTDISLTCVQETHRGRSCSISARA